VNPVIIIPARMGSGRFPGKPLYKIDGVEMIVRILNSCKKSKVASNVFVATCDKEIRHCVENHGGDVVMTSSVHERASDRVAEAVAILEKSCNLKYTSIVMVQGDEPLVDFNDIDLLIRLLEADDQVDICNIMCHIENYYEFGSRNVVKVVADVCDFALVMSRSPIPFIDEVNYIRQGLKQTGVIGFTRHSLNLFDNLPETSMEKIESIDMMRFLQHGVKIKMILSQENYVAVDVIEDVQAVESALQLK